MKAKMIFPVLVVLVISAGVGWIAARHSLAPNAETFSGRKALYYTCAMHPWVRENKPGPCPICGMGLVPVYEGETGADTNMTPGTVKLDAGSINVINVQTDLVTNRAIARTLHFGGEIVANSYSQAWFEFTAYQRDLAWLKVGQTLAIAVPGSGKIYAAQIKLHGTQPFVDREFDAMTTSVKVRAEISDPPVMVGDLGANKFFNGLYAEAHVIAETAPVLAVPRRAVISRGDGAYVYLDQGGGRYALRGVLLGRMGDEFAEVRAGLAAGEKVVTNGSVLIDSEAQLAAGR